MQAITTVGLDIAKSVFQVHGVDAAGQVVIRRQLKRRYVLAFFQKLSPDPLDPLVVDDPARLLQQPSYLAIAVAAVLAGQRDDVGGEPPAMVAASL